jgi:hypothetical protein
MKQSIKRWFQPLIGGGLMLALIAGCVTLSCATLGGAAGAGIGAATHSNVGRSAAIGAGVGGTAGALYDIFGCCRHDHYRGYDD